MEPGMTTHEIQRGVTLWFQLLYKPTYCNNEIFLKTQGTAATGGSPGNSTVTSLSGDVSKTSNIHPKSFPQEAFDCFAEKRPKTKKSFARIPFCKRILCYRDRHSPGDGSIRKNLDTEIAGENEIGASMVSGRKRNLWVIPAPGRPERRAFPLRTQLSLRNYMRKKV